MKMKTEQGKSSNSQLSLQKLNITEYCLKNNAQLYPEKYALILVDEPGVERKITYQELYDTVGKLTAGLTSLHLPKGSIVAIQALDTYDFLILFLATIAADLVPIPMLVSLVEDGINYILNNSNARLFIQLISTQAHTELPNNCRKISVADYEELKNFPFKEMQPTTLFNDPAFIFYTSGSSGEPKGVLHAQHAIVGRNPSLKYWLILQNNDIVMQTDNLCWTYSMFTGFLDPLIVGATAVIYKPSQFSSLAENQIKGELWLQLIDTYKVSVLVATPDIYNAILMDENISHYKIPSLHMAGSAGSLLADATQKRWQSMFHFPIYIALGMTEISTFISTGDHIPYREQTIGKIQPGRKVALLPIEEGINPVARKQMGMLSIHNDELGLMLGYLGESKTHNSHYRGDWFLTQDLLSMDDDGYLTYYGRADSILKVSGGFRVSPIQVENIIKSCEQVKDAACGVIFDAATKTDVLVAYIVSDAPNDSLAKSICQHISKHLTEYKMPHSLYFVDKLVYNARGKLIRKQLHELKHVFAYSPSNYMSNKKR